MSKRRKNKKLPKSTSSSPRGERKDGNRTQHEMRGGDESWEAVKENRD